MHGASFLLQTNTRRDVSNVSRSKDREGGKGMVVLVTGASRGIGRTLAAAAARERHDVVVLRTRLKRMRSSANSRTARGV